MPSRKATIHQPHDKLVKSTFSDPDYARAFRRRLKTLCNPKLSKNAMSLAEQFRQEGLRKGRQQGRQEGLIFSQQQAIFEALAIRFQRVPEGLHEEIETITDSKKLTLLLRAAITRADLESFAAEL